MEIIANLGSLLGLSFISGINLYATVAVVGICTKYQLVQGLSPEFNVLGNDAIILIALALYILEFLVDKVPGFDTLWDSIHTLIRPLGGAMLALMQVGEASAAMEVIVFMLGASLASVSHVTKAGTRLIVNASPEPFSNIIVSLAEDVGAVGFSYLSLAYPRLSFFLTLGFLVLIGFLMPVIFRTVRMLFSALLFRIKCLFLGMACGTASQLMPFSFDAFFDQNRGIDEKLFWTGRAYAGRLPGVVKFAPVQVVITSKAIHFLYRRRLRIREQVLPMEELKLQKRYPGTLLTRWLLRTQKGDLLLYLYQPLSTTIPHDLTPRVVIHEHAQRAG